VVADGLVQQREAVVRQDDQRATQGRGELGRPLAVPGVGAVALAAAVVQEREQLDQLLVGAGVAGQPVAVLPHPRPVRDPVDAVQVHRDSGLRRREHPGYVRLCGRLRAHHSPPVLG
jgi:hypothetical protein